MAHKNVNYRRYPFPANLLRDVHGNDDPISNGCDPEIRKGVSVALTMLHPIEEDILLLRYRDGKTLDEIGEMYDYTGERVRQIIVKGIRKLRHPARRILLNVGLDAYIEKLVAQRVNNIVEAKVADAYQRGYEAGKGNQTQTSDNHFTDKKQLLIADLNMSPRTFNTLHRAEVLYVSDLLKYNSVEDILKIRLMGKRSMTEIAILLNELGFHGTAWDIALEDGGGDC